MEFSGRLAAFPISDILQWAQNDRRAGSLVVRRSGHEKRVFFREGDIVACFSDDTVEFFGQHLLVRGLVEEPRLVETLNYCKQRGMRIGNALVELGVLTREALAAALREHVEDQVCDLFLWQSGIFYFTSEMIPYEQELEVPLASAAVALEGSRRADENERFERIFVHKEMVLRRGSKRAQAPTPLEKRILAAVAVDKALGDLYREVRGSWYRFLEAAYRLTVGGAIDIAEVGDATDSHSAELRLADLLIEQVADEQTIFLRQHLAIPYDALSQCVPVWVRTPGVDEETDRGAAVGRFYAQIDGRANLETLLADTGREERARRIDRLILQLRRGNLALLPMPVDQLDRLAASAPETISWWRKMRAAISGG